MFKRSFILAAVSEFLFFGLIFLLFTVDIAAIGPQESTVGLSSINGSVRDAIGESAFWYNFTDKGGKLTFIIVAFFALVGLVQLIKRKSIAKVDREILCLGGLYFVTAVLYVIFSKIVINYRPVIIPEEGGLESSFPSSHTMLACVVLGSTVIVLNKYISNRTLRIVLQVIFTTLLILLVAGRMMSGVHWFTDIVGGVLLSISLLSIYKGIIIE